MKPLAALVVPLILAARICPAADHPAVARLPVLARIEQPGAARIVVRGALPRARAAKMLRLAKAVAADVGRRFLSGADRSGLEPVALCLFATDRAYDAFVAEVFPEDDDPSPMGFYSPARRLVVANVGRSPGNLRHELAHALIGDDWPRIPDWVNEGLGSLYGSALWTKRGFHFLVNYRLRHLRAARRSGSLPGLDALAASGRAQVYGPRAMVWYGLARYVLLYLDRRGKLEEFIAKLRAGDPSPARQRELLGRYVDWARFLRWVDKLEYPARRTKMLH